MLKIDNLKGFELVILDRFGIDSTPRQNKPCPSCGGRDRFTLFPDGRFYCRGCGFGDALDLIQKVHNCDLKTVLSMLDSGAVWTAPKSVTPEKPRRKDSQWRIKQILKDTTSITTDTVAFKYLTEIRGFAPEAIPAELLAHPCTDYWQEVTPGKWESIKKYAAMVAPVRDADNKVIALHITFLNPDGTKANVSSPKKIIGKCKGGAVKLHSPSNVLGFSEGIETALAANQLFDIPVWATLSASIMPHVEIPPGIDDFRIFADNDLAGLNAARKLGRRILDLKKRVSAESPTLTNDYFDLWRLRENEQNYSTGQ